MLALEARRPLGATFFDGVDDDIRLTNGRIVRPTAYSIAALVKRASNGSWHNICSFGNWAAGGADPEFWLEITNGDLIQIGGAGPGTSSAISFTAADGWAIVGGGRAAGTVTPRHHKHVLATRTTTHAAGSGTVGNPDTDINEIRVGSWRSNDYWHGDQAWVAMWASDLLASDAGFDRLVEVGPLALSPTLLLPLGSVKIRDLVGDVYETTRTGTRFSSSPPPSALLEERTRIWLPFGAAAGGQTFNDTPAGGIVLGGTATTGLELASGPAGGPTLGGTAAQALTAADAPAGGPVLGGTAASSRELAQTPTGGLVLGGAASSTLFRGYEDAPAGGIALGGQATSASSATQTPAGGLTLGGAAASSWAADVAPAGGIQLGGSATAGLELAAAPAGGLILGGEASSELASGYSSTPVGGIVLGGQAVATLAASDAPAGGILLGGAAATMTVFTAAPSGGIILRGTTAAPASRLARVGLDGTAGVGLGIRARAGIATGTTKTAGGSSGVEE